MNKYRLLGIIVASATTMMAGCGKSELNKSLHDITGQSIERLRSYPTGYSTAINGNKVYMYSRYHGAAGCDIFFEVNNQNTIVKTSYKGEACNSFYQEVLKPE